MKKNINTNMIIAFRFVFLFKLLNHIPTSEKQIKIVWYININSEDCRIRGPLIDRYFTGILFGSLIIRN